MKKNSHRLVLECVVLAIELVRLAQVILELLGTAINYKHPHETEVVKQVPI